MINLLVCHLRDAMKTYESLKQKHHKTKCEKIKVRKCLHYTLKLYCYMPAILVLKRLRQEVHYEFKASLERKVRFCPKHK